MFSHLSHNRQSSVNMEMAPKKYLYTVDQGSILSEQQRDFYEANGYLLIKNLVSHDLLDECRQRFVDICEGRAEKGMMTVMKEFSLKDTNIKGEHLICKIQDLSFDDVFFKYISDENVLDIVQSIIGPNITAMHSMLINKPPNADPKSSYHPLHQDLHYFSFRPANSIVASWTAMEKVDENNGCLYAIPGSHHIVPLQPHVYPSKSANKVFHGVRGFDDAPKVYLRMEKGDTVFFHPLLLHGSGPNYTRGFRKAISTHYADSNCYFVDVMGTTQENAALEVQKIAERRGVPMTFEEFWKIRSRLVRGRPGNVQDFQVSKL